MENLILLAIGLCAGIIAGLFGVGGGVIIVPALTYFLGFSTHRAIGTSLGVLLPPVGLAAVLEYYRAGNVDMKAAAVVAFALFLGAWGTSIVANKLSDTTLRTGFGVFVILVGAYLCYSARTSPTKPPTVSESVN